MSRKKVTKKKVTKRKVKKSKLAIIVKTALKDPGSSETHIKSFVSLPLLLVDQ